MLQTRFAQRGRHTSAYYAVVPETHGYTANYSHRASIMRRGDLSPKRHLSRLEPAPTLLPRVQVLMVPRVGPVSLRGGRGVPACLVSCTSTLRLVPPAQILLAVDAS